ncbi:MAG: hypothetical protein NWS30_01555, partial [Verrucomicrobiales bacterium]|nr:hypothetical protein [Verrucomicrobiales bacterium]
MKYFLVSLLCLFGVKGFANAFELPAESSQIIVGTADGWNATHVTLTIHERTQSGPWKAVGPSWTGRLGKNGLVWGRGLHPVPAGTKMKVEG